MEESGSNSSPSRKRSFDEFAGTKSADAKNESSPAEDLVAMLSDRTHSSKRRKKNKSKAETAKESNGASDKPAKKKKQSEPEIAFSSLHKLQSSLKVSDLQALFLYILSDGPAPQWVSLRHHGLIERCVVLMIPGLQREWFEKTSESRSGDNETDGSAANGSSLETSRTDDDHVDMQLKSPDEFVPFRLQADDIRDELKPFADMFSHFLPIKAPGDDKYCKVHSSLDVMLRSPLPKAKEESANHHSRDKKQKGHLISNISGLFGPKDQRTPITEFLASFEELQEGEYVIDRANFADPSEAAVDLEKRTAAGVAPENGWRRLDIASLQQGTPPAKLIEGGSLNQGRQILSIDCEMCLVEGGESALTRVSVLNWEGEVVLDEFVKPEKRIIDYLTQYSGITPEHLASVTTTLSDIQTRLLSLITPHTILIGHSLNSDLSALKITFPFIVDTSIIYPHPRGLPLRSSLKYLAQKFLDRAIQTGGSAGHDSVEDARAVLDLVRKKCEKGKSFGGGADTNSESVFDRIMRGKEGPGKIKRLTLAIRRGDDMGLLRHQHCAMHQATAGEGSDAGIANVLTSMSITSRSEAPDFTFARFCEVNECLGWFPALTDTQTFLKTDSASPDLSSTLSTLTSRLTKIWEGLPPRSLLIVFSGANDMRELNRLQGLQRTFKEEFRTKKWDECSVQWTDVEESLLRREVGKVRRGVGFIGLKK